MCMRCRVSGGRRAHDADVGFCRRGFDILRLVSGGGTGIRALRDPSAISPLLQLRRGQRHAIYIARWRRITAQAGAVAAHLNASTSAIRFDAQVESLLAHAHSHVSARLFQQHGDWFGIAASFRKKFPFPGQVVRRFERRAERQDHPHAGDQRQQHDRVSRGGVGDADRHARGNVAESRAFVKSVVRDETCDDNRSAGSIPWN